MPIPDFQSFMLPILKIAGDGKEHSIDEYMNILSSQLSLSSQELNELLPSGKQTRFYNRITWARIYLCKSGLMETTRRSYSQITELGKHVLQNPPHSIDRKYLSQFPGYLDFRKGELKPKLDVNNPMIEPKTPQETLEDAYQEIHMNLVNELLDSVKKCDPAFFEQLVVDLLVKMGYGGSWQEAARAVGQTGDEGIDGIIDEDRLGLDNIYVQAKKWDSPVSRPEIQKFAGALMGKRSRKGVFITTSHFTDEAINYVKSIESKIILIDGLRLAQLMIDYSIGVSEIASYSIKRVDSDYFNKD